MEPKFAKQDTLTNWCKLEEDFCLTRPGTWSPYIACSIIAVFPTVLPPVTTIRKVLGIISVTLANGTAEEVNNTFGLPVSIKTRESLIHV